MKDFQLTKFNLDALDDLILAELEEHGTVIVSSQPASVGKWGMAKLWRSWMAPTAAFMVSQGVTMPLYFLKNGTPFGSREFNAYDAHELFTHQWLGADADGNRLSWSKAGREGMRAATKGERFHAMLRHEEWALNKGIQLMKPRDSDFAKEKAETGS
jgi:hypothetical protein